MITQCESTAIGRNDLCIYSRLEVSQISSECQSGHVIMEDSQAITSTNPKMFQKRWKCDVCQVKWFLDFEEACLHESQCKAPTPMHGGGSTELTTGVTKETLETTLNERKKSNNRMPLSLLSGESQEPCATAGAQLFPTHEKSWPQKVHIEICGPTNDFENCKVSGKTRDYREKAPSSSRRSVEVNEHCKAAGANSLSISTSSWREGHKLSRWSKSGLKELQAKSERTNAQARSQAKESQVAEIVELSDDDDDAYSKLSGTGKRDLAIKNAPPVEQNPPTAMSDVSDGISEIPNRRTSKRLRQTKQPKTVYFDSGGTSTKNHRKKKKQSNVSESEQSSLSNEKGTAKSQHIASIFSSKKLQHKVENASVKNDVDFNSGISKQEYAEHVAAEKFFARRKRAAENVVKQGKKQDNRYRSMNILDASKGGKGGNQSASTDKVQVVNLEERCDCIEGERSNKGLSKNILAEHYAANFFARRKQSAAEERERQRKRDELRQARTNEKLNMSCAGGKDETFNTASFFSTQGGLSSGSSWNISYDKNPTQTPAGEKRGMKYIPAIRFPCPSHVVTVIEAEPAQETAQLASHLSKTPKFQYLKATLASSILDVDNQRACPMSFLKECDDIIRPQSDSTFNVLSSIFSPRANDGHFKVDNQLWSEKYTMSMIPHDVLGDENKQEAKKFIEFVEEWKARRNKSMKAMSEQAKRKQGQKKKKKSGYDSDDSFIDDSKLENIFLITGPSAAGKTRLVHAVAEQCNCVVLEINSTEQRGGPALKRAVQESTQCHSSVAILKQSRKKLFTVHSAVNDGDSGSEAEGSAASEFYYDESDDEEESTEGKRSLTIILIDEGEILYVCLNIAT